MSEREPGKEIIQPPYDRRARNLEAGATDDLMDRQPYSMKEFSLVMVDPSEWRVYPNSEKKRPGSKEDYVSIPPYLGKIMRNAIYAQNRAHSSVYTGHDMPDYAYYADPPDNEWHLFFEERSDYDPPQRDEDEGDESHFGERGDYDDDFAERHRPVIYRQRAAVSEVMRDTVCHDLVMEVLNMIKSPDPLKRLPEGIKEAAQGRFKQKTGFTSLSFSKVSSQDRKGYSHDVPQKRLQEYSKAIEQLVESLLHKAPLVVQVRDFSGIRGSHEFMLLGRTQKTNTILCFEKMDRASMPFRVAELQDIILSYYRKGAGTWRVAAVEDLLE